MYTLRLNTCCFNIILFFCKVDTKRVISESLISWVFIDGPIDLVEVGTIFINDSIDFVEVGMMFLACGIFCVLVGLCSSDEAILGSVSDVWSTLLGQHQPWLLVVEASVLRGGSWPGRVRCCVPGARGIVNHPIQNIDLGRHR